MPYHPELLLGSRGRFPDNGRRDEAKHTLTSRGRIMILKTKPFAFSIFAILPTNKQFYASPASHTVVAIYVVSGSGDLRTA